MFQVVAWFFLGLMFGASVFLAALSSFGAFSELEKFNE
jgi:hypothetical protein